MSPSDTEKKGDLHELPECAPEGLKELRTAAEGIIQEYFQLLGSGSPSKAPDPQKVFQDRGITNPDHQATMINDYSDHKTKVDKVKTDYDADDDGVSLNTEGIGSAITDAYAAMGKSVDELNETIDTAHHQVQTRRVDKETLIHYLPNHTIKTVFDGIWKTLDETYEEVSGVSDQAAARALKITGGDEPPPGMPTNYVPPALPLPSVAPNSPATSAVEYVAAATDADYARYTGNTDVRAAIEGALDALGIHDPEARERWTRGYLVLIERESNNNPNAINNWDSNAASGKHSRGLTQTIPSTFESYHVPGTSNNIYDPVANVAASMNYVMNRYDVAKDGSNLQSAVQQTNPAAPPKGY